MLRRAWMALVLGLAVGAIPLLLNVEVASGQAAPPTKFTSAGFSDEVVANVDNPTALAFTRDGRMLVTNQRGALVVFDRDGRELKKITSLVNSVCSNSERGLLGVAVDPNFASNNQIYLYWTWKKYGDCQTNTSRTPVNLVTRHTLSEDNVMSNMRVLINNIPSPAGNHNAGDLQFGRDGYLYVSVGDGARSATARDRSVLSGKILRITRDGGIPAYNPFTGKGSARCNIAGKTSPGTKCQEIFASGLRNPFRMAFDPNAGGPRFFINDVGQAKWEEIDLGRNGADYGWDVREGFCAKDSTTNCGAPPAGMTNPVAAYGRGTGCSSITGGAFVPNGAWPSSFNGSYLFGDFVCNRIYKLSPTSNGKYAMTLFSYNMGQGGPVAMVFGPNNDLYYTSYSFETGGGQVRRISHAG